VNKLQYKQANAAYANTIISREKVTSYNRL